MAYLMGDSRPPRLRTPVRYGMIGRTTKDGPGGAANAVIPGLTPTEEGLMSIMLAHWSDKNQTPAAMRRVP